MASDSEIRFVCDELGRKAVDEMLAGADFEAALRTPRAGRVRPTDPHPIWQGTVDFFNYCLKGGKDVSSSGGRLYCDTPGSDRTVMTEVKS